MQEIEDPTIKLFGQKIPLSGADATCEMTWMEEEGEAGDDEGETEQKQQRISTDAQSQSLVPSVDGEGVEKSETSRLKKESSKTSDSQRKTLKRQDKILPCPRCDSTDTKFCYYNNYNVKQPRYFCRACQRYWTAGGSMRNMLVGAGSRKNKSAACRYRHIMFSGALSGAKVDVLDCILPSDLKSKGTVPRFGVDIGKTSDGCSSASSVTISNSANNGSKNLSLREQKVSNCNGIPSQIPCLLGFPWPYPCNHPVSSPALYPAAAFWTWKSHQPSSTDGLKTSAASTDLAIPGERSREPEGEIKSPKQGNGCLVVPKTLRINDPREAAKSSIWTSLGIAHDSNAKASLSNGIKQKGMEKVRDDEKLPALQANPAALSRSLNFRQNN